ncbi:MAG: MFS transporter [Alphaproteobacteria bacterium]|nr:MFS transporter [Alphaproteobacteria bacterium]
MEIPETSKRDADVLSAGPASAATDAEAFAASSPKARRLAFMLLLAGAVCAGMGQTIVFSILPPIARDIGVSDLQVVLIFMISAVCWVVFVPRWGRRSDDGGRKPFILIGLIGFAVSMVLFGASIEFGLLGALSGAPLYILLVLTRSLYGVFGSAGPPAAQAYIADRTTAVDRTAGIASFSAAFGLGAMLGPGFGAVAALLGPTAPFFAIAGLAAIMSVAVYLYLPERTRPKQRKKPVKMKLTDRRIRPFLIFGLIFGVANAILVQTIAFYFMDMLGVTTAMAPQLVGLGLMGGAMAALFSQIVVVQRFGVEPRLLMRIAPVLIVAGHGLIWTLPHLAPVIFGMVLSGFGAGLAVPGFNAAASLAVRPDEQGAAIGLTGAAGASGFIIAPLLGVGLYSIAPQIPYIGTTLLGAALWVFAMTSRAVGDASPSRIAASHSNR